MPFLCLWFCYNTKLILDKLTNLTLVLITLISYPLVVIHKGSDATQLENHQSSDHLPCCFRLEGRAMILQILDEIKIREYLMRKCTKTWKSNFLLVYYISVNLFRTFFIHQPYLLFSLMKSKIFKVLSINTGSQE